MAQTLAHTSSLVCPKTHIYIYTKKRRRSRSSRWCGDPGSTGDGPRATPKAPKTHLGRPQSQKRPRPSWDGPRATQEQEGPRRRQEGSGGPKKHEQILRWMIFCFSAESDFGAAQRAPRATREAPRALRGPPMCRQERPGAAQERPKSGPERPRGLPGGPRGGPGQAHE